MTTSIVYLDKDYLNPNSPLYSDTVKEWSDYALSLGLQRETLGEQVKITAEDITVAVFLDIKALDNNKVEYFTCSIRVLDTDIDNEIPDGLPNRIDPNTGNPHTWRTWHDEYHPLPAPLEDPENVGVYHYYLLSYPFGVPLTDDELMIAHNVADAMLWDLWNVPYPPDLSGAPTTNSIPV